MSSDIQTFVAPEKTEVIKSTVITFIDPPHYRNNNVDLSTGDTLKLLGIDRLTKGKNQGDLRAKVPHIDNITQECDVIIESRYFKVVVNYTGLVNIGIVGH
jgi:hypothetical protein